MAKTRVVVVDDSALVRSMLTEIINRQPDMECIGAAADPLVAREMIRNLNPDVITLDVEMRRMDGIDFLSKLMRLRPMPVVMVSTLTERGAEVTLKALELGAIDFVAKPKIGVADGLRQLSDDITDKIRVASKARIHRLAPAAGTTSAAAAGARPAGAPGAAAAPKPVAATPLLGRLSTEKLIFIGASTGGTEATKDVLIGLPADSPAVVITQHMPPGFTRNYAARLVGPNAIGIMLTGMGADGAKAMREMKDAGAYCVAQDEASCVVFGMPREAINAGAVQEVLPLSKISQHVLDHLRA